MANVKSFTRGQAVLVGSKWKNHLGVAANAAVGVTVTITDPDGTAVVTAQSATQDQWDEDDSTTTGQYYYVWQSASDDAKGRYKAVFTFDDTYDGVAEVYFNLT